MVAYNEIFKDTKKKALEALSSINHLLVSKDALREVNEERTDNISQLLSTKETYISYYNEVGATEIGHYIGLESGKVLVLPLTKTKHIDVTLNDVTLEGLIELCCVHNL